MRKKTKKEIAQANYLRNQKRWVQRNQIETGSMVTITKKAASQAKGCSTLWTPEMNLLVGQKATVIQVVSGGVWIKSFIGAQLFDCIFPYFILRKVKRIEEKGEV